MTDADPKHERSAEDRCEGQDRPEPRWGKIGKKKLENNGKRRDGKGAGKPSRGNAIAAPDGNREEEKAETLRDEKVRRHQEARATHRSPYARHIG
ncbi:hypothetical protein J2Y63_001450 [Shinella sp. BE166]|uniref:hypothetical protein n=1 Tax=Shinella sp. BE166 TaxID=3373918 RepID=UPI003EB8A80B